MDFKNVVYNAARDGKLRRLKVFLDERKPEEILMLIGSKTNGATPLVMACRNGHLEVVQYLVDKCNAHLEQTGSVVFDGETIEGAPPLWCAAAAGHYDIVKFLVASGANVNSTTRTDSTPLRAACFDGHFEIVKFLVQQGADMELANRHGHTCLMIACYKGHYEIAEYLLGLGADVNRKSLKGNTALHDAAESGSLDILKMLLARQANIDGDSHGMTPLLAASVTGHTHIVEYLIQLENVATREEKIHALELLGATYVDKKRDMIGALELWKRAMNFRYAENEPPLPKALETATVEAYEHCQEKRSIEELDDMLADPDDMRMQALLIRERILGPAHPDTSYYIRYRGAVYADAGKFSRCVSLWLYALDMQQRMLEPLNPMTQSSLFSFTELFAFIIGQQGSSLSTRTAAVSVEELLSVLSKGVAEVEAGLGTNPSQLNRVLVICLQLASLALRLKPGHPTTMSLLYKLLKLKPTGVCDQTPLHLACNPQAALVSRYRVCRFPNPELVSALVKVGGDPRAVDASCNTPLHIAAMHLTLSTPSTVVTTLLNSGAHFDSVNIEGRTFASLLPNDIPIRTVCDPMKYTTLACLAARTIRRHHILPPPCLPPHLQEFLLYH